MARALFVEANSSVAGRPAPTRPADDAPVESAKSVAAVDSELPSKLL